MHQAGFTAVDVHMSDLIAGRVKLDDFQGIIAVGGFSYGDVLGAGEGWAKTILFNSSAGDSCALLQPHGQLRPRLQRLPDDEQPEIHHPGAHAWPKFTQQVGEIRRPLAMVEVLDSPSIFFNGMAGTQAGIAIAHGEGYADFSQTGDITQAVAAMRFVDNRGAPPKRIRTTRTARRKA
jgi:phosphoribosylformylglycinamidine synthase